MIKIVKKRQISKITFCDIKFKDIKEWEVDQSQDAESAEFEVDLEKLPVIIEESSCVNTSAMDDDSFYVKNPSTNRKSNITDQRSNSAAGDVGDIRSSLGGESSTSPLA